MKWIWQGRIQPWVKFKFNWLSCEFCKGRKKGFVYLESLCITLYFLLKTRSLWSFRSTGNPDSLAFGNFSKAVQKTEIEKQLINKSVLITPCDWLKRQVLLIRFGHVPFFFKEQPVFKISIKTVSKKANKNPHWLSSPPAGSCEWCSCQRDLCHF